jgi:hypothetical protein
MLLLQHHMHMPCNSTALHACHKQHVKHVQTSKWAVLCGRMKELQGLDVKLDQRRNELHLEQGNVQEESYSRRSSGWVLGHLGAPGCFIRFAHAMLQHWCVRVFTIANKMVVVLAGACSGLLA